MALDVFPTDVRRRFELLEWKHASSILAADFPEQFADLVHVLRTFRLSRNDFTAPGGNKSDITKRLDDRGFLTRGWAYKQFQTSIRVDATEMASPTHEIDCFKDRVALEIEWNNKDPFFDRDLNNFRLLFDLRAISIGIIITKSQSLVPVIQGLGKEVWDKFGRSTTWMDKLLPRIEGGGGGGCPLLAIGITAECIDEAQG